jgi:hypothetical protein
VEIRITRNPKAVRKFMDKGPVEGCEVKVEGAEEPKTEDILRVGYAFVVFLPYETKKEDSSV